MIALAGLVGPPWVEVELTDWLDTTVFVGKETTLLETGMVVVETVELPVGAGSLWCV